MSFQYSSSYTLLTKGKPLRTLFGALFPIIFFSEFLIVYFIFPHVSEFSPLLVSAFNSFTLSIISYFILHRSFLLNLKEREKIELTLNKLSQAVEQSPSTVVITDTDGIIEYVNRKFTSLTGYSSAEVIGQSPSVLKSGTDPIEKYKKLWDTILAGKEWEGEFHNKKKNGDLYWEKAIISPIVNGKGDITHFVALKEDITEKKLYEEALHEAYEHLSKRTSELTAANEEIKSFATMVSHDLKSPLVNIKGFADEIAISVRDTNYLLEEICSSEEKPAVGKLKKRLCVDIPESLTYIQSSISRMNNLIAKILKLARLGSRDLHYESIKMNELICDILKDMSYQIEEKKIDIVIESLPTIVADRLSMEQIMSNLIENAVKYFPSDKIGKICVSGCLVENKATFNVEDNGIGIDERDIPKIFQCFSRVENSSVPGEGIGLAFVQTLVRRHGGTVSCNSTLGKGTIFTFSIYSSSLSSNTTN